MFTMNSLFITAVIIGLHFCNFYVFDYGLAHINMSYNLGGCSYPTAANTKHSSRTENT